MPTEALCTWEYYMSIFVMLITLSGSYGFTGGAPVIQGFHSLAACQAAIPKVSEFYKSTVKVECLSLPSG